MENSATIRRTWVWTHAFSVHLLHEMDQLWLVDVTFASHYTFCRDPIWRCHIVELWTNRDGGDCVPNTCLSSDYKKCHHTRIDEDFTGNVWELFLRFPRRWSSPIPPMVNHCRRLRHWSRKVVRHSPCVCFLGLYFGRIKQVIDSLENKNMTTQKTQRIELGWIS